MNKSGDVLVDLITADIEPEDVEPSKWTRNQFREAAKQLGYDSSKLSFPRKCPIDVKEFLSTGLPDGLKVETPGAGMLTNMLTGEISVFPKNVPTGWEKGVLAHEIFHVAYARAVLAWSNAKTGLAHDPRLVRRFKSTLGNPASLADIQHVSVYADFFLLRAIMAGSDKAFAESVTEVLSEMARIKVMTGKLVNSKPWKRLYNQIDKTAKELGVIRK